MPLLERMEEVSIRMFLTRKTTRNRGDYLEVDAMEKKVGEVSRGMVQPKGLSTKNAVDLLSTLERMAKTFVDISDLALPTYQFSDDTRESNRAK